MTSFRKCTWRLRVVMLLIAGLSIWFGFGGGPLIRTMVAENVHPADQNTSQSNLDYARESALKSLYGQIKAGAPSSLEEREVLLRFANREPITELEADTVTSRAIYLRYVAGQPLTGKQKKLLRKYEKLIAQQDRVIADVSSKANVSPTGAQCNNYTVSSAAGASISSASTDTGNHCEDCATAITLPFPYTLYDQTFTSAAVSSNGVLQFTGNSADFNDTCLPAAPFSYSILPYWDDLCTGTDCGDSHTGFITNGILTAVGGTAPDRFFDIEWRASYSSNPAQVANFSIRLYENQLKFDIVYGQIDQGGASAVIGVQRDASCFTQFECHTAGVASGTRLTFMTTAAPCSLTCPADITTANTPGQQGTIVSYPSPTGGGACGTVTCSPASGSFFPVGATTVVCNTSSLASCSFTVTVQQTSNFDLCLQDDSSSSTALLINGSTGDYIFCCGGARFSGRGALTVRGGIYTLQDNRSDRRLLARIDTSVRSGSASLQSPPGSTICTITDRNTSDDKCACQ
jgi:HYR domain